MAKPLFNQRRKLSNSPAGGGANGLSFSGNDAYDGIFSSAAGLKPKLGAAAAPPGRKVAVEDYSEIFGTRNGKRGGSIPVLDLDELDATNGWGDLRSSGRKVDYSVIFGGGNEAPLAVPAFEELFKTNEAKARNPSGTGSPLKGSDRSRSSENIKRKGCESSDQMLDSGKQFNMSYHKIGQRRKDVLKGTTHITQLNAVPGFTYVIDESVRMRESQQEKAIPPAQTEVNCSQSTGESLQKTEQDKAVPPVKAEVNSRSPGKDKFDGKVGGRTKWQVPTINASEGVEKHKVEDNKNADYSKDKLSNANDFGLKSHVSVKPSPSGYSANKKESMGHKWSKLPSFGLKAEASESSSGYATPFSEEDLDANSAAAASIEALKKALEQAQETIRIAKEKMEKKSRSRDSLKATSRSGTNCAKEASSPRYSNVMETCKIPESEVQDPIKFEMEIKSGHGGSEFSEKEKPATRRHTDGEKDSESVEVAGDNGVATWFSQLLNNGKQKMAALASELVVKKNSGLQPVSEDIDYVEIKPAKMTSESVKKVSDIDRYTEAQLNVHGKSEDSERNMDSSGASQCVNYVRPSETLIFSEKEEVAMSRQQNFDKEEGDKVNPEHYHKAFSDVQFELPELGTILLESDLLKVEEKSFERETSRLDDFSVRDGDSGMVDEVVNRKEQEEYHPVVDYEDVGRVNEDDEPHQAADYMSDGKRPEVDLGERLESCDKEESDGKRLAETDEGEMKSDGKRLAETDEGEMKSDGKRLAETDEGEMKQLLSEKESLQKEIDGKPHKKEDSDSRVNGNSSESQKIEVNEELQECGGESWDSSFYAVHDQSFDAANAYGGANLFNFQNTCIAVSGKMSEQTSRLGIRDLEEKGDLAWSREESSQQESRNKEGVADNVEITEQLTELDGEAKAELSVEGQSNLVGEDILGMSSMYHINDEMNIMKSVTQDVSTASGSTVKTATFDFISMLHESQQSKNLGRSSFSSHGTEQGVIEDERASETAECKNSSTSDFSAMDEQTQVNESDRKFACNSDDLDGSIQEVHGQYHIEESDGKFACNSEDLDGSIHEEQGQYQIEEGGRESKSSTHAESESESESESQGSAENGDGDGIACDKKIEEDSSQRDDKEQEWVQNEKDSETSQFSGADDVETDSDGKTDRSSENCEENVSRAAMKKEKETGETLQKEGVQKDEVKKSEVKKRDVKRERDRMAVDRAIREARERAFAEARERAERAAVEKAIAEANQRTMADAREKHDSVTSGPKVQVVEASIAAKRRVERAAVERATAEARERALSKAMSQKAVGDMKTQTARDAGLKHSYSSSELENNKESALRRKAKLEKDQRINERAAKALHEKNFRDALAQREQAQKNRLAETLDAEIKRWASGKEGNLRALLSTLQYILGSDSGWKPISLTDIVTSVAVKKAYRQATLHVHPDKLQQRGASIRQKYICEKVFDLLQAAWNKYNSEER